MHGVEVEGHFIIIIVGRPGKVTLSKLPIQLMIVYTCELRIRIRVSTSHKHFSRAIIILRTYFLYSMRAETTSLKLKKEERKS
jgi:hypothetical protein